MIYRVLITYTSSETFYVEAASEDEARADAESLSDHDEATIEDWAIDLKPVGESDVPEAHQVWSGGESGGWRKAVAS